MSAINQALYEINAKNMYADINYHERSFVLKYINQHNTYLGIFLASATSYLLILRFPLLKGNNRSGQRGSLTWATCEAL